MGNENRGDVEQLVQAGSIGQVHFHQRVPVALRAEELQPGQAGFVDREAERAELDAAVARSGEYPACVLVSGPRGSGKTALVRQWMHESPLRFRHRIYLDLRDRDATKLDVISHCLHAFGLDVPASADAAEGLFRSFTREHDVALVLDDVANPRDFLPLVPSSPGGLLVLIAWRQRPELAVDGVVPLGLRRLDAEPGVALLRTGAGARVDAEPEQARRIVELCGGLPIAIRITAGWLAKWPTRKLARIVAHLEGDGRLEKFVEDGVPVVLRHFDEVLAELPTEQRALHRLLGHVPGPTFAADAVAALAELSTDDAEDLLAELHEANLLERTDQDEYRFHDLVRLHAERLHAADDGALRRLVDWYRVRGAHADRAVLEPQRLRVGQDDALLTGPNPFTDGTAREWLDRERVNLVHVLAAAHEQGWDRAVISLCDGPLWTVHQQHKHYADVVPALDLGIGSAQRCGDLVAESRLRTLRTQLLLELREFDAALESGERARELAERAGHRRVLASALEFLGKVRTALGDWDAALELLGRSREINLELGKPRAAALQEYLLARALVGRGEPAAALEVLAAARHRLRDFPNDRRTPDRIRVVAARAHQALGRHAAAVEELRAAEAAIRARGGGHDLVEPLELLAESARHDGNEAAARAALAEAAELLETAGHPDAARLRALLD
ncbi:MULTISPECIES: AAA family ATPase [unclassified Saccharopolyspora]|uniref:AAA family ATPase n=1 Tax=unclassified Saccharopolyspora TaxID=2646250 RepID=UPI001CD6BC9B|nr:MULTISPECIES: AAA family ATPase [unclassified Saccharopolyspora]MCA1189024.1 AAA family ATPase [Saccharopolyspora sp. 6T]MCA1195098.1 AAA family ATPase [Saccharopolyspora sp. 6V]MCA1228886.1 AAA family ATPase [Saccharopolyspora sp. 6M]MCA1281930.1 AAA family ATPase [Saccharopolyspora sp. 7B]